VTEGHGACVLDASAMLALLHSEPGAEAVEEILDQAAISTVNWSEVCQRWLAHDVDVVDLRADIEALGVQIVPFTAEDAEETAALWSSTRRLGLSLGDRACLGLARRLERPAVTADRLWLEADVDVDIRPIR
jgi:ribonuclease VapC